jgi:hypothetical protein
MRDTRVKRAFRALVTLIKRVFAHQIARALNLSELTDI